MFDATRASVDNDTRKTQAGDAAIEKETVFIYQNVPSRQTLRTSEQSIRIESDARCAVIWNWGDNAKNVTDIGEGNNAGYLCVERGDLADYALTLAPGEIYERWMSLSCRG